MNIKVCPRVPLSCPICFMVIILVKPTLILIAKGFICNTVLYIYLHLGQKFELIIHIVVFDVEIMQCHWKQMRQTVI